MDTVIIFKESLSLIKQTHFKILSLPHFESRDKREKLYHISCLLSEIAYDLEDFINEKN